MSALTPPSSEGPSAPSPVIRRASPSSEVLEKMQQAKEYQEIFIQSLVSNEDAISPFPEKVKYFSKDNTLSIKDVYSSQEGLYKFFESIPEDIRLNVTDLVLDALKIKSGPLLSIFPHLEALTIEQASIKTLDPGPNKSLAKITIPNASSLTDIEFLRGAPLESVTLKDPVTLTSIEPLNQARIKHLEIPGAKGLRHTRGLSNAVETLAFNIFGVPTKFAEEIRANFPKGVEIKP